MRGEEIKLRKDKEGEGKKNPRWGEEEIRLCLFVICILILYLAHLQLFQFIKNRGWFQWNFSYGYCKSNRHKVGKILQQIATQAPRVSTQMTELDFLSVAKIRRGQVLMPMNNFKLTVSVIPHFTCPPWKPLKTQSSQCFPKSEEIHGSSIRWKKHFPSWDIPICQNSLSQIPLKDVSGPESKAIDLSKILFAVLSTNIHYRFPSE